MKNLPKEKRDKLILTVIGTVAVIAGLYLGLIKAMGESMDGMTKQTDEKKTKVVNAQRLVNSTSDLQKGLEEATAKGKKSVEAAVKDNRARSARGNRGTFLRRRSLKVLRQRGAAAARQTHRY